MVKAKGKARRTRIADDEQALKDFEKATPIVRREKQERQSISSSDLVVIMTDTFERLFQEFVPSMGERERLLNADDRARLITRVIKYGFEGSPTARIVEREQEAPLCNDCK